MKGFIKIIDVRNTQHYVNINYIIEFIPTSEGHEGNAFIQIKFGEKVSTLQTPSTCEEIADMINSASN